MKKVLFAVLLLLLPLFASARENEPTLLPDGTLCTVEERYAEDTPDVKTTSSRYLVLSIRRGNEATRQEIVPATLDGGAHSGAAMAYDAETRTLFLFWVHRTSSLGSELLFASFDEKGKWSEATAFGAQFNRRENLRIAVTRKVFDEAESKLVPGLTVHATWWEFDSQRVGGLWSAQYAMLAIEKGQVASVDFFDLSSLVVGEKVEEIEELPETSVLRHPQVFAAPSHDSVIVVYGDVTTNSLHQARIFPVRPQGRIRIPIGRREGGFSAPGLSVVANSGMGSIFGDVDRFAFYVREGDELRYVILRNDEWSEAQTIALDSQISGPAAVDAIRRLLTH